MFLPQFPQVVGHVSFIRPSLAPCPSLTFNAIFLRKEFDCFVASERHLPGLLCLLQTTKPDAKLMPPRSPFQRLKVPFAFPLSVFGLIDGLQGDV